MSGISENNSGGTSSNAIGNRNVDDGGWEDVSKKKRQNKSNKNKSVKQRNPYIEVIDPIGNGSNDNDTQNRPCDEFKPFLVLLVGMPGSGKSTFAQSLIASMPNKFCRINQDELKTRKKCENKLKRVFSASPRLCPIIDRCNFDGKQRSTWYRLAEEAAGQGSLPTPTTTATGSNEGIEPGSVPPTSQPTTSSSGIPVDVVVLDLPYEECLRRCEMRKGHETIKSPRQAAGILKQLRREWSPPHHRKNEEEKSRYRSLTIVRTDQERKECLVRILKQNC